jgi:hypothetical protein
MRFARLVAASAAFTLAVGLTAVATSFADAPPDSFLQANPTSLQLDVNPAAPVNVGDTPHSASVTVGLDANCQNAISATKYTIVPGTSPYVSVSPSMSSLLKCGQTYTFTVTGTAVTASSTLAFDAVAKNQGLQKKIGGTTISIVVIDTSGTTSDCTQTNSCPTNIGRPAAPAVANALLNTVDGLASSCQKVFKGKDWRGNVISTIANAMPKPESVKDDLSLYPTDADWVAFVKSSLGSNAASPFSGLYGLCGGFVETV